jgi:hypothetical protein
MAKAKIAPPSPDKPKAKALQTIEVLPQLKTMRTRADALIAKWQKPAIESAQAFEQAGQGVKDFAALRKELKSAVDPAIKEAKKLYDERRRAYNAVDEILEKAEQYLRAGLIAYTEKHRKAQEVRVERALASGNDEKAAAIAAKPYTPDVVGLAFRETWHGEVTDFKVYLTAILDGRLPPEAVIVNEPWLNARARAEHEAMAIPGAVAVKETSSSVRT